MLENVPMYESDEDVIPIDENITQKKSQTRKEYCMQKWYSDRIFKNKEEALKFVESENNWSYHYT
jgi:hypothetical protein